MDKIYDSLINILSKKSETLLVMEATVPTGLETEAFKEILLTEICTQEDMAVCAGRIYFTSPLAAYDKVVALRSVDNISILAHVAKRMHYKNVKDQDLKLVEHLVEVTDLLPAVALWALITKFDGIVSPTKEQHDAARIKQDKKFEAMKLCESNRNKPEFKHDILKYRVTCDRVGKHSFTSNDAAYAYGGQINNKYFWIVALSDFDLNILLRIHNDAVMVLLKVTVKSLHHRSLIHLGPTSLRPTIAYGMLSLAKIEPGDHVVDPLCGSGSIPIECMFAFPQAVITCGDINDRAVHRTFLNISQQETLLPKPSIFHWNAKYLPLKNDSVDVIVSDLPFGKRSGSKRDNTVLYKRILIEFHRVLRNRGRLILLTKDSPNLYKAVYVKDPMPLWKIQYVTNVNVGALKCVLLVVRPVPM